MHDYDIEIIDDQGALSLLPQPADAVLEIMIDPGPPVEIEVPGVQGPPGPASTVPGPTGPTGATGPQGATGSQGPQGNTGSVDVQSMTQAAYDALPVKNATTMYVITDAPPPVGLTGPAGPVGPAGPQGQTGSQGAASTVPGPTGSQGPQGPQGIQGPAGPTGADGPTGPIGSGGSWGTVATIAALPATGSTPIGAENKVTAGIGLQVMVNTPTGWQVSPYADSGWQSISTLGVNGWSLTGASGCRIRRQGYRVRLKLDALAPATWNALLVATAPVGFTYTTTEGGFATNVVTSESGIPRGATLSMGTVSPNANYLRVLGATIASGLRAIVTLEYLTDDAWPTVTPQ